MPILYEVDRSRDGKSFTTRRVTAIQHGAQIFNLAASFQDEEAGFDHQEPMPEVPGPEVLPDQVDNWGAGRPIDMRWVDGRRLRWAAGHRAARAERVDAGARADRR